MIKILSDNFTKELKKNAGTRKFYRLINQNKKHNYGEKLIELYDVIKEKFDSEKDQQAILTYIFEQADSESFRHTQDYFIFINHMESDIRKIHPKENSFYYIYALSFPKEYQKEIFFCLSGIGREVRDLMKDIYSYPYLYTKKTIASRVYNPFLPFRKFQLKNQSLIDQNYDVTAFINAVIDDAIEYICSCITLAQNEESYCDECNNPCHKRYKKDKKAYKRKSTSD